MKNIWLQSLIITGFVFGMLWGTSKLLDLKLFTAFDTVGTALQDFHLTDYVFSQVRVDPEPDQRIILVNIGDLDRMGIAQQILYINQYKPKVIAIDVLFRCEGNLYDTVNCPALKDTLGNLMLASAIKEAGNVVLGDKLLQKKITAMVDTDVYDSIEYSDEKFREAAKMGFVSLPTAASHQEDVKSCRTIFPYRMVNGSRELAFSTQIAMRFDSVATLKYLARKKDEELINFRGNIEVQQFKITTEKTKNGETSSTRYPTMFYAIDVNDLAAGNVLGEVFKDNIVIMGFMGSYLGQPAWEDKFFTPLNKKVAGRANPDMFGVVLHANVVAMILNEDFINELPEWLLVVIAAVTCFFTVALLIVIDLKLPAWFDALSFIVQIVIILIASLVIIQSFAQKSLSLDLTLTIAVIALVGPCYDIFKSLQNEYIRRFTKPRKGVLKDS